MAPHQPQPVLQSLPPILSEMHRTPIPGCSKGSRGLSVQPRVLGIFTETTISPDPSLRQRPSRYAIRAGRNLPDKEFRYLRTVIVTAAVYWGLDSKLRPKANLSSCPSSTGQASAPIRRLSTSQRPVFLVNSRLGRFTAAPSSSIPRGNVTLLGRPFSRSYGAILPSSLTRVLPIALVFSTCLPVSVLVRARATSLDAFLGGMASRTSSMRTRHPVSGLMGDGFPYHPPYAVTPGRPSPGFP